jgi:hypothetical protein
MRRLALFIAGVGLVAAATFLYQIKFEVQQMEQDLAVSHDEILRHQEAIHVLEADWAYLTRPERIAELAERHLGFQSMTPEKVIELDNLPLRQDFSPALANFYQNQAPGAMALLAGAPLRKPARQQQ